MKKILFVWLSIWSLAMVWSSLQDPGSETPNTSINARISTSIHTSINTSINTVTVTVIVKTTRRV